MKTQRKTFKKPVAFMYFWWSYCNENTHQSYRKNSRCCERHRPPFRMASEMIEAVSGAVRNERAPPGSKNK